MWGDRFVSESALTTRIKSVRQAVGDDGTRQGVIRTVHGKGYEFVAEVRVRDDAVGTGVPPRGEPVVVAGGRAPAGRSGRADRADRASTWRCPPGDPGRHRWCRQDVGRLRGGPPRRRAATRDGVHAVELATVDGERAAVEAFATVLEVSTRQMTSIEDAIVDTLSGRRELLVLDNCEHVIEPVAALVGRILRAAPDVSMLATSREPLAVAGEHVRIVEPLPSGDVGAGPRRRARFGAGGGPVPRAGAGRRPRVRARRDDGARGRRDLPPPRRDPAGHRAGRVAGERHRRVRDRPSPRRAVPAAHRGAARRRRPPPDAARRDQLVVRPARRRRATAVRLVGRVRRAVRPGCRRGDLRRRRARRARRG